MTVAELMKKYYFHDSMLESIRLLDDHSVELVIDICRWMQDDYQDSEEEMQIQRFVFKDVNFCEYDEYDIDSDSILEARALDDQTLELVVLHESDESCHIVRIRASYLQIFV